MDFNKFVNEEIIHKVYGAGIIESSEDGYINVSFSENKKCKFSVPSCFDKFIKLTDESKQQEVEKSVLEWKKENGIFEKELLEKKTISTQEGIKKREKEREIRRLKRAKEVAERNRMFISG